MRNAMPVRLDTREARQLTSREIAKLIGGITGGLSKTDVRPHEVNGAVRGMLALLDGRPVHLGDPSATWIAVMGGLIGGMISWCRVDDVRTALQWTLDHWSSILDESTVGN